MNQEETCIARLEAELVEYDTPEGKALAVKTDGRCTVKESILLVNALIHSAALECGSNPDRFAFAVRGIQGVFEEGTDDGTTFIRISDELAKQLDWKAKEE